jgi:hypothetical protein
VGGCHGGSIKVIAMRLWQGLLTYGQQHPWNLMEVLMLSLAIALLVVWGITEQWPYLVLSLSYAIGASVLVLIRSYYFPHPQKRITQTTAILCIICSVCSFADLLRYF